MVISVFNPVYSVFWLISAFIGSSVLFIILGVDFIALVFLIVYVGAIAILFLFVIMMLDLIDFGERRERSNYLPVVFLIGVVFLLEILIFNVGLCLRPFKVYSWYCFESVLNIEVLGRVLYTSYIYIFIIASFILLVAMIGAIELTGGSKLGVKRQESFYQISRLL